MLGRMLARIEHRGPDGEGRYVTDEVALGHRRLAIIDLSEAGHEPMTNEREDVWVTYNGEVYNYRELMRELQGRGHTFKSQCDAEVLIHGYEEYGPEMLRRFNGIWGFALWDQRRRRLMLARDRIGVKPVYYCQVRDYFLFASEIKALLDFLPRPLRFDEQYLYKLLRHSVADDDELTSVAGVRALPAGSYATIAPGEELEIRPYWELDVQVPGRTMLMRDAVERFQELFASSVDLRFVSDAPLGLLLSGGLDSAGVISTARQVRGVGLEVISSVYREPGFSEEEYIEALIERCGVRATVISPRPAGDWLATLEKIVWHLDGPSTSQGNFVLWHLMRTAREENKKVMLSGNGGDEVLSGYHPYFRTYLNALLRDYQRTKDVSYLARFFVDALEYRRYLGRNYVTEFAVSLFADNPRLQARLRMFQEQMVRTSRGSTFVDRALLSEEFERAHGAAEIREPAAQFIEEQTHLGLRRTIMPTLLRNEDRMSMAWGVEMRQPFLDYRVVEFLTGLDYRLKTRGDGDEADTAAGTAWVGATEGTQAARENGVTDAVGGVAADQ